MPSFFSSEVSKTAAKDTSRGNAKGQRSSTKSVRTSGEKPDRYAEPASEDKETVLRETVLKPREAGSKYHLSPPSSDKLASTSRQGPWNHPSLSSGSDGNIEQERYILENQGERDVSGELEIVEVVCQDIDNDDADSDEGSELSAVAEEIVGQVLGEGLFPRGTTRELTEPQNGTTK